MNIAFELPQDIEQQIHTVGLDLNRKAKEVLLVGLYRQGGYRRSGSARPSTSTAARPTSSSSGTASSGTVDRARQMAAHAITKTTELYNHTGDESTLDEVERIAI